VLQHHPLYSNTQQTSRWVEDELAAVQEQWLHRYGVNMLLAGHNHNYERSYPMAYQVPTDTSTGLYEDPVGWIQVTSGGAGKGLYDVQHPANRLPYSAEAKSVHHHVELEVDGERVDVTAVQARFPAGQVIDAFSLVDTDQPASADAHAEGAPAAR
jgi:hypothetical protein